MLPDRVSNPGPLTYESGALPIVLRGPASKFINKQYNLYFLKLGTKALVTLQSLLVRSYDDNQASKKIRDQKENKRTNSPYDNISHLSTHPI